MNLPTAVPYVFDFDNDLRLINDYFLGDPEEIKKLMEAVAKQGQKSESFLFKVPQFPGPYRRVSTVAGVTDRK